MSTLQKLGAGLLALVLIVVVLIVAIGGHKKTVGDATVSNYPTWYYGGIVIGPSNSMINDIVSGSCTLSGGSSIADRATETLGCAVPAGVKSGEAAFVSEDLTAGHSASNPFVIVASGTDSNAGDCSGLGVTAPCMAVTEQNQTGTATSAVGAALAVHFWITR